MRRFYQHLLVLALFLIGTAGMKAQDIALFYDPAYVDTQPNCNGEAYNLLQFLTGQGFLVTTFTGTDQTSWENATLANDVIVIPEFELALPVLDPGAVTALQNFVADERLLITFGDQNDVNGPNNIIHMHQFLNTNFGWAIETGNIEGGNGQPNITKDQTAINMSCSFDITGNYPNDLDRWDFNAYMDNASFPPGALELYNRNANNAAIVEMPYGGGRVYYYSWDYFDAGPGCATADPEWNEVILNNIVFCLGLTCFGDNPVFQLCPGSITVGNDVDSCGAYVNYQAVATDSCMNPNRFFIYEHSLDGGMTWVPGTGSGEFYPVGITNLQIRAYNPRAMLFSIRNCNLQIEVLDTQLPTAVCLNQNVIVGDACTGTLLAENVAGLSYDNCEDVTYLISRDNINFFPSLDFTQADIANSPILIYSEVCDQSGNCQTCTAIVYVVDEDDPMITCPADLTVNMPNGACHGIVPDLMATVSDNCMAVTVTQSPDPGVAFGGAHGDQVIVTLTADDGNGNVNSCDVTVTVNDTQAPQIPCPIDVTVSTSENGAVGDCEGTYTWRHPVPLDNCGIPPVYTLNIIEPISGGSNPIPVPNASYTHNFDIGLSIVTYFSTDAGGNVGSCSFTVTVVDDESPVINCPSDILAQTSDDGAGDCATDVSWVSPSPTDNCDNITSVNYVVVSGGNQIIANGTVNVGSLVTVNLEAGTYRVSYTAIDGSGNSAVCSFEVIVEDDEDPTISCAAIPTTVSADPGECSFLITDASYDPTYDDNCSVASITHNLATAPNNNTLNGATLPVGMTTVTWTVTDSSGNTVSCMVTIAVEDNEIPAIINCPADLTIGTDNGVCQAVVTFDQLIAEDNCTRLGNITWEYNLNGGAWQPGQASGLTYSIGTTTVQHRATDEDGNISAICEFDITVVDDEDPEVVCTPVVATVGANCDATVTDVQIGGALSTDNCGITSDGIRRAGTGDPFTASLTFTLADFPNSPINVEYEALDAAGNRSTCVTTVTLVDETDPVITCPADVTVNTEPDACYGVIPDLMEAFADDNCDVFTITQTPIPGTHFGSQHGDVRVVTLTIEDTNGNMETCTVLVTLNDNQFPAANFCNQIDINIGTSAGGTGDCLAEHTVQHPLPTDNCTIDRLQLEVEYGGMIISTADVTPGAIYTADYGLGLTSLIYTAIDEAGNETVCITDIFVTDDEAPEVTCPMDITIGTSVDMGDDCAATYNWVTPTPTDNCDDVDDLAIDLAIFFADGTAIGTANVPAGAPEAALFPLGTSTVRYTVTDQAGNVTTCEFTVTVEDDEVPTITCAMDMTFDTDPGTCERLIRNDFLDPVSVDDNCMVDRVEHNYPFAPNTNTLRGATFYPGTTTVTWTVYDEAGNSATCEIDITIEDNELPQIINCPGDQNSGTDNGLCSAVVIFDVIVADDNCTRSAALTWEYSIDGGTNWLPGQASGLTYPVGTTQVQHRATDEAGNTSLPCIFNVIVTDDEDPEVLCNPIVATVGANCDAIVTDDAVGLGSSDNCGIETDGIRRAGSGDPFTETLSFTLADFQNSPINIEYQACDEEGNCSTCITTVTLIDETDPTIVCPDPVTVNTEPDVCYGEVPDLMALIADDNCEVFSVVQSPIPGTHFGAQHGDVVVVSLIITDTDGNMDTCMVDVTLNDNQNPYSNFCNQIDVTIGTSNGGLGDCQASYTVQHPTPTDNCTIDRLQMEVIYMGNVILDVDVTPGAVYTRNYDLGLTSLRYTAYDEAGNATICITDINVVDDEAPQVVCPADVTIGTSNDGGYDCMATHSWTVPDPTDNCDDVDDLVINELITLADGGILGTPNVSAGLARQFTFPIGTSTIRYTIIDQAGNEDFCEFLVTVEDDENPMIVCPADITLDTDNGTCEFLVDDQSFDPVSFSDNCEVDRIQHDYAFAPDRGTLEGATFFPGTTTITWTIFDEAGNSTSCSFDVTIEDNEAPLIINCLPQQTSGTDNGVCEAVVIFDFLIAEDNCTRHVNITWEYSLDGGMTWLPGQASGLTYPIGLTTVQHRATDEAGNVSEICEFTVLVVDDEDPEAICTPVVVTVGEDCDAIVTDFQIGGFYSTDNCGIVEDGIRRAGTNDPYEEELTFNMDDYLNSPINVEYRACDAAGNCSICVTTVTLIDETDPEIVCPEDITVNTEPGFCYGKIPDLAALMVSDNCDVFEITQTPPADVLFGSFHGDQIVVSLIIEDLDNNKDTCMVTVTLNDNEAPEANFCNQIDLTIGTSAGGTGDCEAIHTIQHPLPTDNCTIDFLSLDILNPDGTTEVSNVTPGGLLTRSYQLGLTRLRYLAVDEAGNSTLCITDIIVVDDEAPEMTCPDNVLVPSSSNGTGDCLGSYELPYPNPTDNCDDIDDITLEYIITFPNANPITVQVPPGIAVVIIGEVGVTNITYRATDQAGNVTECFYTVTFFDDEDPTITCPASPVVLETDPGECEVLVTDNSLDPVMTDDNCTVDRIRHNYPYAPNRNTLRGATFYGGTTMVTWTVFDEAGNSTDCQFTVEVEDNEAPVFLNCPDSAFVIPNDPGWCGAVANFAQLIGDDNCTTESNLTYEYNIDNNGWVEGQASNLYYEVGIHEVQYRVTDEAGNISEICTFQVIVEDKEVPNAVCVPTTVVLGENCEGEVTADQIGSFSSDNCEIVSMLISLDGMTWVPSIMFDLNNYQPGPITVFLQVCDAAGNCSICATSIYLTQEDDPDYECPADITVDVVDNACYVEMPDFTDFIVDECGIFDITQLPPANTNVGSFHGQVIPVQIIVTDLFLGRDTCTFNLTLNDNTNPTMTSCPSDVLIGTRLDGDNDCQATYTWRHPVPLDNCAIDSMRMQITDPDNITTPWMRVESNVQDTMDFDLGTTTIRYEAFDEAGNIVICIFSVTVVFDSEPVVDCIPDVTGLMCGDEIPPGATTVEEFEALGGEIADNCAGEGFTIRYEDEDNNASYCSFDGPRIVTRTYTITNANGTNSATCEQRFFFEEDLIPPTIFGVPQVDITVACTEEIPAVPMVTAEDNCMENEPVAIDFNEIISNDTCQDKFVLTRIWTARDLCGNESVESYTITVRDTIPPMIFNVPLSDTVDCQEQIPMVPSNIIATDNCVAPVFIEFNEITVPLGCDDQYDVVRTWTAFDACGNRFDTSYTIFVRDTTAPVIVGGADYEVLCDQGNANNDAQLLSWLATNAGATATDNCSRVTWENNYSLDNWVNGCGNTRYVDVTFFAYDDCDNVDSVIFRFGTVDTIAPIFQNCPRLPVVENAEFNHCDAYVNFSAPFALDNCSANITINQIDETGLNSGDRFPVGTTILTFEAVDECENRDTCEYKIIVNDYWEVPQLLCPDPVTQINDLDDCGAVVDDLLPAVNDVCSDNLVIYYEILDELGNRVAEGFDDASGEFFPKGVNELIYTVRDQPLLMITEVTQELGAKIGATNPVPGYFDGDLEAGDYVEISNFGSAAIDLTCVSLEITSPNGSECLYTLPTGTIVQPGEVVVIHVGSGVDSPANLYFNAGCDEAENSDPRAYILSLYNHVIDVVTTNGFDPLGTGTTAIVEADDWSGTSENLPCFAGYYRNSIIDENTAENWSLTESCEAATLGSFNPGLTFANFNGDTTSLQSLDPGTATCTTLVTIDDEEAPTCIEYDTLIANEASFLFQDIAPGECYSSVLLMPFNVTIGEIRIKDLRGTFPDMNDIEFTLISPKGTEISLWRDLCSGTSDLDVNLNDNSAISIEDAACGPLGNGGTYRPVDSLKAFYGENAFGEWTLQVDNYSCEDVEPGQLEYWEIELLAPRPYSQGDTTIVNAPGECGAPFTWQHPVLEDNCCIGTIRVDYESDDNINVPQGGPVFGGSFVTEFFEVGTTRVIYTLTDASGNTAICSFEVTVLDVEKPMFLNCPSDVTITLGPGECDVPFNRAYEVEDNCEIDTIIVIPSNGSGIPIGDTVICVIAIDIYGNSDTCKFRLTVEEYIPNNNTMNCNNEINISLDATCYYEVNADIILEGNDYRCYNSYIIELLELPFLRPHAPVLTIDDIGKCFQVKVIDPISGNSCWGKLCVEDKQAPEVDCPPDLTLACNEPIDPDHTGRPELLSCEQSVNMTHWDQIIEYADCDDIRLEIVREWRITDESGNRTTCIQNIAVRGFDLADVRFPRNFDDIDLAALACDERRDDGIDVTPHIIPAFEGCVDDYLLDSVYFAATGIRRPMVLGWNELTSGPNAGNPSPFPIYYDEHPDWASRGSCWGPETNTMWFGTGTPTINGQSVYSNNAYCSLSVRYTDEIYEICGNSYQVLRYWRIFDMCKPGQLGVNPIEHLQVIKIIDRIGPDVVYPDQVTVGMDPWQCLGTWNVPEPWIQDNCQDSTSYTIQTREGRARKLANGNWIVEGLPAGTHTLQIIAKDACNRRTVKEVEVNVVDDVPPVAVCETHTIVSIPGGQNPANASTKIEASSFDDGSYDNCNDVWFKVVRMTKGECNELNGDDDPILPGYQEYPDDFVQFCCEDVGQTIMVRFLVFDVDPGSGPVNENLLRPGRPLFGHYTECMVEVDVQNKEQPTVVAPPTIVVSCDFWFDINALTDPNDPTFGRVVTDLSFREKVKTVDIVCPEWCEPNFKFNYFPPAGIEDKCALYDPVHPEFTYEHLWGFDGYVSSSCGSNPTIIVNDQRECGQGRITRTISVPGQNGPVTATQTIYFVDCNPYYITDENCFNFDDEDGVIWPCDMELRECEASTDPSITGRPTILNEDNCSLVAVKYEDEVFDVVPNACFKIIRTWTILDWCQYDPSINLTTGRWEYEQIILVNDARKPVLEGCADVTFCDESAEFSAALNACVGYASLSLDSVVDCTPYESLVFEYKIDAFNDGTYDFISSEYGQVVDDNPLADDESNARDASGKYPLGTHRIKWFVEDMCGNLQTCEYLFTIEDCKNPTPYCRTGIVTVVMELSGEVEVWARDLDVGSFDNCPGDLEFHFDSLGLEEGRVFDCDDLGTTQVEIWVTDASGNKDFCTTTIEIQDPNGACGSTIRAEIAGTLESRTNDPVGQAVMTLYDVSKQAMQQMTTDQTGKFSFRRLPIDQIYTVKPERNNDPLNGVSTRDLIFIQRHLLGIEELGDPLKLIAADVNNSKGVSAKDLVELRKLILGLYNGFDEVHTDQRSWRFIDKKHVITDPVFPYDFPESVTFEPLTQPELNTHFTGIKIGDIDGNARANNLMPIESRSNQTIHLQYQDRPVRQGERVVIPVTSADFRDIVGMQFTLNYNMELVTLTDIHSGVLELNESNLGMHLLEKGMATFSWNSDQLVSSSDDEVLFTLVAEVNKDASLKDVFHISSRMTTAEAYQGLAYEPVQVVLNEDDTDGKQGFALLQNVPNPFSAETIIGYILPTDMDATLSIYDQNGKVLWLQVFDAVKGYNEVIIKSSELPAAGILYYQLDTETFTDTKRMVHIR